MGDGRYQTQSLWLQSYTYCTNENNRNDLTFNDSFIHCCADNIIELYWLRASKLKNNRKLSNRKAKKGSQSVMRAGSSKRAFD